MQKKIILVIANLPYAAHTENLSEKYNIYTAYNIYNCGILREDYFGTKRNNTLLAKLAKSVNSFRYSTRTPEVWKVPLSRTNYGCQMLCNNLPRLLNSYGGAGYNLQDLSLSEFKTLLLSPL